MEKFSHPFKHFMKRLPHIKGANRFLILMGLILLGFEVKQLLYAVVSDIFHQDELQHTHVAWNILNGKIIFKDFFEHHGPLTAWTNVLFLKLRGLELASSATLFSLRYFNLALTLLTAFFTFLCVNSLTKKTSLALFSAVLYLSTMTVQFHGFRSRPEVLVGLFFVLWFYLWSKGYRFFSGIVLGICVGLHPKFLPINIPILLGDFFYPAVREADNRPLYRRGFVILGELLVLLAIGVALRVQGCLAEAVDMLFVHNWGLAISRVRWNKIPYLLGSIQSWDGPFIIITLILLFFSVAVLLRKNTWRDSALTPLLIAGISSALFLLTPLWGYSLLFIIPIFTILISGILVHFQLEYFWISTGLLALALTLFFMPFPTVRNDQRYLLEQVSSLERALTTTSRSEPIMYIWPSKCPAFVFNADSSMGWANPVYSFPPDPRAEQNRFADPKVSRIAIEENYMNGILRKEKHYLESHFDNHNCLWERKPNLPD